jgi:hypothetical protein
MKTRSSLAILILLIAGLSRCGGSSDTVTGPPPPVTAVPPPTVTPFRGRAPSPTPTPSCRVQKLCQGGSPF